MLHQRRYMDGKKDLKRCSTLLFIGEMQIKTTIGQQLHATRMAIIKETGCPKCCKDGEELGLVPCWWEREWYKQDTAISSAEMKSSANTKGWWACRKTGWVLVGM